jgi:hypothetical protein
MWTMTDKELLSTSQVLDEIENGLKLSFIQYLVEHDFVTTHEEEKMVKSGRKRVKRKRYRFSHGEVERIKRFWMLDKYHNLKPAQAVERIDKRYSRILISLQVSIPKLAAVVRQLKTLSAIRSFAYFYEFGLLLELSLFDDMPIEKILRFYSQLRKDNELQTRMDSTEFDVSFMSTADLAPFDWSPSRKTLLALVLVTTRTDEELITENINSLEEEGLLNVRAERISGMWDIMIMVETADLVRLRTLTEEHLAKYIQITRTAVFIASTFHFNGAPFVKAELK